MPPDCLFVPHNCAEHVEMFAKYVWRSGWRVMPHHALPIWLSFSLIWLVINDPNSVWSVAASLFPATAPIIMMLRLQMERMESNFIPSVREYFHFYGLDEDEGRPIKVVYRWMKQGTKNARWEQAFSYDDGKSWETNWIIELTKR